VEATTETYYLSEYFSSIQGEGNYAGVLSLFLRFHFCNLTCSWCDSKYTWNLKSGKYETLESASIKTIISNSKNYHVIFTGGEPTLYSLDKLVLPGKKYHVESNGTIIPTKPFNMVFGDQFSISRPAMDEDIIKSFNWVISPKLSNSRQILNEESLQFWAAREYCIFKFVIRNTADLEEVTNTIQTYHINQKKIYIALEGQTLESQIKPELVDSIMEQGFNFSPRLHVMLWGAKRGK
jgi:7-carboxy-7-deazaguanine synthase